MPFTDGSANCSRCPSRDAFSTVAKTGGSLAPGDGRPYPPDARPNDLLHWQTNMVVQDPTALEGASQRLLGARGSLVSPGVVAVRGHPFGLERALLVRDPDGHAVRLAVEAVGAD